MKKIDRQCVEVQSLNPRLTFSQDGVGSEKELQRLVGFKYQIINL
jgi:hypothetical protein